MQKWTKLLNPPELGAGAFEHEPSEVALLVINGLIEQATTCVFSTAFPGNCRRVDEKFSSVIRGTEQDRGLLWSGVPLCSNASRMMETSELVSTVCEALYRGLGDSFFGKFCNSRWNVLMYASLRSFASREWFRQDAVGEVLSVDSE